MSLMEIGILAAIFISVSGGMSAMLLVFTRGPLQARLQQAGGGDAGDLAETPAWQEKLATALAPASKLSLPSEGWQNSPMRRRFLNAGYRNERAALIYFGCKTVLAAGLPGMLLILGGLFFPGAPFDRMAMGILLLAAIGYYLPNIVLGRRITARQREVFERLPDAIDLMTVMVEAGLGLDAAIARVADEIGSASEVLGDEFRLVGLELRAGASRSQALRNLALRTGVAEVEMFVAMLVQTDRFGTSMAESLRTHSDGLRTKRRILAEEAAAKIGLKLLFPQVFCIFPAIMVVLMGPAVIAIYRNFFPIAAGS
jgi:tight adherence protein C